MRVGEVEERLILLFYTREVDLESWLTGMIAVWL